MTVVIPRQVGQSVLFVIVKRLCEYSTLNGTGLPFPVLCKVFRPMYREKLSQLEKFYFKRVDTQHKQK